MKLKLTGKINHLISVGKPARFHHETSPLLPDNKTAFISGRNWSQIEST